MHKLLAAAAFVWIGLSSALAQSVELGTSPQGTLTYAVGTAISKALAQAGKMHSKVLPSSGTGTTIPLVNSGKIDIGFCNTLELYDAYHGVDTFEGSENPKLRTVAVLFPIKVGLLVRANSPIRSVKDLKGKRIAYGFTSQAIVKRTVDALLATGGLDIEDLKPVTVPNLVRGVEAFIAGDVDVTTFAIGSAKVAEADAAVGGIRFISIADTPMARAALKKAFPTAYLGTVQPAPEHAGVLQPIVTMIYDYTMFANADMPAEQVKRITEIVADNRLLMAKAQPQFNDLKRKRMFSFVDVPYHDGAVAYYREKGIPELK